MSAHWYWDWNWGRPPPPPPPPPAPTGHKVGKEVPEKMGPERGPCKKSAVYKGNTDPGNPADPAWHKFILREVDGNDNPLTPPAVWEYYWVSCARHDKKLCCQGAGGCEFYETRVRLRKTTPGGDPVYITDFKCKCNDP